MDSGMGEKNVMSENKRDFVVIGDVEVHLSAGSTNEAIELAYAAFDKMNEKLAGVVVDFEPMRTEDMGPSV